jgi:inner membrane protein involved in colicin E2 resistance
LFGGLVSLVLLILILVVFFFKINDVINFNQTQIKKNTLVAISNSLTPPQNLSAKNITMAFMLSDFYGENVLDDPKYGKFILKQFIIYITPTGRVFTDF